MIADIGERVRTVRRSRLPRKLVVASLSAALLLIMGLGLENSSTSAAEAPTASEWQAKTVLLPQTSMGITTFNGWVTATYHFRWNSTLDFSSLNWSTVDEERTDQRYVLGLGAKIWVSRANIRASFPIEMTQGDGTSLDYRFEYTSDRATPHIYLTGERSYWKWDQTPGVLYDYRVKGSCSLEDAWRNGTWSPEEGISLKFKPEGSLVLGKCDFGVQMYVYEMLVPEFTIVMPVVGVIALAAACLERSRRSKAAS